MPRTAFSLLLLVGLLAVAPAGAASRVGRTAVSPVPTAPAFDGNPCSRPVRDDPSCPRWNRCSLLGSCTGDAPDPSVVKAGGLYLAFSTGTELGNSIQLLVSDAPDRGYHAWPLADCSGPASCTARWGSSAFGALGTEGLPSWVVPGTTMAPAAAFLDGRWLLYFAARSTTTGRSCLGVAELAPEFRGPGRSVRLPTSASSPALFRSVGDAPLRCEPPRAYGEAVGLVDPSVVVDPTSGQARLLYKTNDGSSPLPAHLLSQPLSADGLRLGRGAALLLTQDTTAFPWQQTIENPEMLVAGGRVRLLYSAGIWSTAGYAEAEAVCSSVTGPCWPEPKPFLTSQGAIAGPGGGSVFTVQGTSYLAFHAWDPSCIGYPEDLPAGSCRTGARRLFVAPLSS